MEYISLSPSNIATEHICCAFSDKKCQQSYQAKKDWLTQQFEQGYVFKRLNQRAKVFIEYGPAETAWLPIVAPNYLALGCFWVSGKYKGHGHGLYLLNQAIEDAKQQAKLGLVAVAGRNKNHFMSDSKWLIKQGFVVSDETADGFVLLCLAFDEELVLPSFAAQLKSPGLVPQGCVVYFSNRCPFAEYHATQSLRESCKKRHIPLTVIKLDTCQQAQNCPSPATIFSLFYNGRFVTTDISACMDSRFDKFIQA
ncbi:GNAT family N-acetyltransferase [Agarivorans sp. QJM3NY_33]|uniref:GNAT family N-acetyltransferase n=1 Tax=Agarivorans sp. QJM3NY_33 TaxID=3421432 RepID=UPI003D7E4CA9